VPAEISSVMMKKYLSQVLSVSGEMYMARGFKKSNYSKLCFGKAKVE
jgi:hypothetical protein